MYEELIEWLRTHAKSYEEMFGEGESSTMMRKAADAIEELSKRVPPVPHGRLGDLDALAQLFKEKATEHGGIGGIMVAMAAGCIDAAPTIIPAEEETT